MCLLHIYLVPHVCLSTHMYLPLPSSGTTCMSAKILHNLITYHLQLVPHGFMLNTCTSFSWYHMHMCHKCVHPYPMPHASLLHTFGIICISATTHVCSMHLHQIPQSPLLAPIITTTRLLLLWLV